MALPNSRFAEMLRRNLHRRGNSGSNWDMGTQEAGAATALSLAPFKSTVDSYSDDFSQVNKTGFLSFVSSLSLTNHPFSLPPPKKKQ